MPRSLALALCLLLIGACGVVVAGAEDAEPTAEQAKAIHRDRELKVVMAPLAKGKQRLLYVTPFGDRDQVRLRVTPYPEGAEAMLWETPCGGRLRYLLPSPDRSRVLIAWEVPEHLRYTVVTLRDATASEVKVPDDTDWAVWRDGTHLSFATEGAWGEPDQAFTYDLDRGEVLPSSETLARNELDPALPLLQASFGNHVETAQRVLKSSAFASLFELRSPAGALVRGAGLDYVPPVARDLPLAHPAAAVSPDGRQVAFAPTQDEHKSAIHMLAEKGKRVAEVALVPLSRLVRGEGVWVSQLQWTSDGTHLLYTETHFHPARSHAPDVGSDLPDPSDWTYLVRQWDRLTGQAETILVGRDAWLIPDGPARPGPTG